MVGSTEAEAKLCLTPVEIQGHECDMLSSAGYASSSHRSGEYLLCRMVIFGPIKVHLGAQVRAKMR